MHYEKIPIREFIISVLNTDEMRTKLNEWDLEVDWVAGAIDKHYLGMGMFFVPKAQIKHIELDIVNHIDFNQEIRKEVTRKMIIRKKQNVRVAVEET